MHRSIGLGLLFGLFVYGCAMDVEPDTTDEGAAGAGIAGDGSEWLHVTTQALSGPTNEFQSYTYTQSNGGAQVERFAECAPDQVLTGFGGRVDGNDNFTDVTVYCRSILSNGALASEEDSYQAGGPSQELQLHASNGMVIVGLGGIVSNTNVFRIVAKQCKWIASTQRLDLAQCSLKSTSPGSNSTEQFVDTHAGYASGTKPRVVGAGAGMTATNDNVFAVRMTVGLLK